MSSSRADNLPTAPASSQPLASGSYSTTSAPSTRPTRPCRPPSSASWSPRCSSRSAASPCCGPSWAARTPGAGRPAATARTSPRWDPRTITTTSSARVGRDRGSSRVDSPGARSGITPRRPSSGWAGAGPGYGCPSVSPRRTIGAGVAGRRVPLVSEQGREKGVVWISSSA